MYKLNLNMKKSYIIIGSIILFLLIILFSYRGIYNNAVSLQEGVDESWGNVQATYQRRADLIPQLVDVVMGAVEKEGQIVTDVTRARAGLPSSSEIEDLKNQIANADSPEKLQLLEKQLKSNDKSAQAFLNVAVEAYPNLKSIDGYKALQNQLEGTENRIGKARDDYNESIKKYNTHIRGFFTKMVLNSEEFPKKTGFEADKGAENKTDDTKRLTE
jgi:LemA protein